MMTKLAYSITMVIDGPRAAVPSNLLAQLPIC